MVGSVGSKMYPTKSMLDYMIEMNLHPRTSESDMFQSPTPASMSFNQSSMAHSSSSTETSPESFPDLTPHTFAPEFRLDEARKLDFYQRNNYWRQEQPENRFRHEGFSLENAFRAQIRPEQTFDSHVRPFSNHMHPENPHGSQIPPDLNNFVLTEHIYETPAKHRRPIMGRKIMTATEPLKNIDEFSLWQPNMPHTPPKSLELKNDPIYELFPSEHRGFKIPSPINSPQHQTSPRIPLSPRSSTPITPPSKSEYSPRVSTPFKEPLIGPNTSFTTNYGPSKMCTFCRKNGETPVVYMTHLLKEKVGNKNVVTCPILRSHVCSTCGVSGDNAHTITYCPVLRSGNNGQPLQSTTITLKNTRVKSNGRRRY